MHKLVGSGIIMFKRYFAILALGYFSFSALCFGEDSCKIAGRLVMQLEERGNRIRGLYSLQEKAIPILIDEIDSSRKMPVILSAPNNSNIEGPLTCYCGVLAAYMIETILAKSDLFLENPSAGFFWEIATKIMFTQTGSSKTLMGN
jgi:hypothetical protein